MRGNPLSLGLGISYDGSEGTDSSEGNGTVSATDTILAILPVSLSPL